MDKPNIYGLNADIKAWRAAVLAELRAARPEVAKSRSERVAAWRAAYPLLVTQWRLQAYQEATQPAAQHKRELMAMGQTAYRLARAAILKAKGRP